MTQVFLKTKFSDYLGEQRALLGIYTGFDPDYQAILDYASTLSGVILPTYPTQVLQNYLVQSWKESGFWDKAKSIGVFATDSNNIFAFVDWKRLTVMTPVDNISFVQKQGFAGNGTSSYINTNFNASGLTLNDAGMGVYVHTDSGQVNNYLIGDLSGSVNLRLRGNSSNTNGINCGVLNASVNLSGTGFRAGNKISSLNTSWYSDETRNTRTSTTEDLGGGNIFLLRRGSSYSSSRLSMFYTSDSIDGQIYLDMRTAFLNYLREL